MSLRDKVVSAGLHLLVLQETQLPALSQIYDSQVPIDDNDLAWAVIAGGVYVGHMIVRSLKKKIDKKMSDLYVGQAYLQTTITGSCMVAASMLAPESVDNWALLSELSNAYAGNMVLSGAVTGIWGHYRCWFDDDDDRGGSIQFDVEPDPDPGKAKPLPIIPTNPVNDYSPLMTAPKNGIVSVLNSYRA